MSGSITPLPVMLEEEDQKRYEKLEAPKSLVVRYGYQKLIAELAYNGDDKPGCGSKMVIRTQRGIELGEMLTSTCPNAGCGKSITRKEMLKYIENSGGKDYPFTDEGKVLRVATIEDMNEQARLDAKKPELIKHAKSLIQELDLPMRLVEVELLLGGERIIFYYTSEDRVDFRELVRRLASSHQTRIEMRQVNAREEARLVADYEKCGQHCCCKQFLKVLKPVSMRSAKVQKATLDPLKISGRCGRLMCCLRYEDETYEDLRKRLPHRKSLVETEDGIGLVLDSQILTQLVLVQVGDAKPQAYPMENIRILGKAEAKAYQQETNEAAAAEARPRKARGDAAGGDGGADSDRGGSRRRRSDAPTDKAAPEKSKGYRGKARRPKPGQPLTEGEVESREGTSSADLDRSANGQAEESPDKSGDASKNDQTQGQQGGSEDGGKRRRRRSRGGRRRRRRGGGGGSGGEASGGSSGGGGA